MSNSSWSRHEPVGTCSTTIEIVLGRKPLLHVGSPLPKTEGQALGWLVRGMLVASRVNSRERLPRPSTRAIYDKGRNDRAVPSDTSLVGPREDWARGFEE